MRTHLLFGLTSLPLLAALIVGGSAAQAVDNYFVYVSGAAGTQNITCYSFNPATAGLSAPVTSAGGTGPGYLAWSSARTYLYAINSSIAVSPSPGFNGGVTAFTIDATTGALSKINDQPSGGSGPTHLCVHPSGNWVFVAHFTSGQVTSLPVVAGGGLGSVIDTEFAGAAAHMALTNAAGTRLYVPCRDAHYVAIYRIDPATGLLTPHPTQPTVAVPTGAGPRHMAFTSDETHAYVINELDSTMSAFSYDRDTDLLTLLGTVSTLPSAVAGNTCAHVEVSNDDRTLFGSNRGHDSIVSYDINSSSGLLSNPRYETRPDPDGAGPKTSGIQHPRDFTIDPTGQVLLVAGRDANLVSAFTIAPTTGALAYVSNVVTTNSPTFVGVMLKPSMAITLTSLAVTPATATVVSGSTRDFDARGRDQFGALMYATPSVTWSVSGPGTINPTTGLFTAGATGTVTITANDGTRSAAATVTTTAAGGGSSGGGGGGG